MKRMTDKMAQQMLTFFADRLDIKPIMANCDPDSGYWWETRLLSTIWLNNRNETML